MTMTRTHTHSSVAELIVRAPDGSSGRRLYSTTDGAITHGMDHARRWLRDHIGYIPDLQPTPVTASNPAARHRTWFELGKKPGEGPTVEVWEWHVHDGTEPEFDDDAPPVGS